jgi:DNA helicase-2/ATP-dependent DNA helicase PcrA
MERYILRREPASETSPRFRIDYAGVLNPAQLEAVTTVEGPVLVVAGAGSGKTRTLVYRVARLVEMGIDPTRLLLLTFTRKAAGEMLRRATELLDGRCEKVAGGTFHSFANLVLRRHGEAIGVARAATILDRGDAEDVIDIVRAQLGLDKAEKRFPRKQTVASILSMAVNKSVELPSLVEESYVHLLDHLESLMALRHAYADYKQRQRLLDYDDLLLKLRDLLAASAEVRQLLGRRYAYVMVDEYQDTNRLQAEIVRLLASEHDNVMAVGDDAQSVYSFRGAHFRNIMDFPRLFPGTRIIALEENYRSTQAILDTTNAVIEKARERYTKRLFTRREGGETPLLVAAQSEQQQSQFVCQRILELREEGVPLREIAVLFRSSFHSFDLELELARRDIPFVKRGGFRFVESAHIKDVLAHLRIVANPLDAVSWFRVLRLLEGIGPKTAVDLTRDLGTAVDPAALLEQARRGNRTELAALAGLLRRLAAIAAPAELVQAVVVYYDALLKRAHPDDFPKRQRDLEQFGVIAARFASLEQMLSDMALEPPGDSVGDVLSAETPEEGLLTLSTIHSAKGLEWHSVFVIWALEGRFPSLYNLGKEEEMEEERRLFYVASTRAKEKLYVSFPLNVYDRGSGMILGQPSRFVEDIPETILRRVMVVEEE